MSGVCYSPQVFDVLNVQFGDEDDATLPFLSLPFECKISSRRNRISGLFDALDYSTSDEFIDMLTRSLTVMDLYLLTYNVIDTGDLLWSEIVGIDMIGRLWDPDMKHHMLYEYRPRQRRAENALREDDPLAPLPPAKRQCRSSIAGRGRGRGHARGSGGRGAGRRGRGRVLPPLADGVVGIVAPDEFEPAMPDESDTIWEFDPLEAMEEQGMEEMSDQDVEPPAVVVHYPDDPDDGGSIFAPSLSDGGEGFDDDVVPVVPCPGTLEEADPIFVDEVTAASVAVSDELGVDVPVPCPEAGGHGAEASSSSSSGLPVPPVPSVLPDHCPELTPSGYAMIDRRSAFRIQRKADLGRIWINCYRHGGCRCDYSLDHGITNDDVYNWWRTVEASNNTMSNDERAALKARHRALAGELLLKRKK